MLTRVLEHLVPLLPPLVVLTRCGMGTVMIEAKLVQQLSHLEQEPFYGVFLGLKKAFNTKEREGCLLILEGYGAGPNTVCLICIFWQEATLVCCVSDHYGGPF